MNVRSIPDHTNFQISKDLKISYVNSKRLVFEKINLFVESISKITLILNLTMHHLAI